MGFVFVVIARCLVMQGFCGTRTNIIDLLVYYLILSAQNVYIELIKLFQN